MAERLKAKEKQDMQKLIRMIFDSPLSNKEELLEVDGERSIEDFKKANVDIKTRILLQITMDAMKGDRQCAEFLFKYGGFEPPKEQHVTMETPTIIDDMAPKQEPVDPEPYIPKVIYDDPDESED